MLNLISLSPRIVSLLSFAGLVIDGKDTYFVHDSIVLHWSGLGERKFHDCQVVHPSMMIFGAILPASISSRLKWLPSPPHLLFGH